MQKYQASLTELEKLESALLSANADSGQPAVSEDYFKQLKSFIEEYPGLSGMHMKYFERHQQYLMQNGPSKQ